MVDPVGYDVFSGNYTRDEYFGGRNYIFKGNNSLRFDKHVYAYM